MTPSSQYLQKNWHRIVISAQLRTIRHSYEWWNKRSPEGFKFLIEVELLRLKIRVWMCFSDMGFNRLTMFIKTKSKIARTSRGYLTILVYKSGSWSNTSRALTSRESPSTSITCLINFSYFPSVCKCNPLSSACDEDASLKSLKNLWIASFTSSTLMLVPHTKVGLASSMS